MRPKAAPALFPYPNHRTMAEVMAAEDQRRAYDREWYRNNRKSWRTA